MSDQQWAEWLRATGGTGAMFMGIFVIGLVRKWWVLGWLYLEKDSECREWKAIALRTGHHVDKALDVATKTMEGTR